MSTPISEQDVSTMRAAIEKWVRLGLAADWDGLMALMTDDVVFLPPDVPAIEGEKSVRAFLGEFPPIKTYESQILQAEGLDDFAWVRGTFSETLEIEPGKSLFIKGKWTGTYRKQPDGSWLISSLIWNSDEPAKGS